MLKLGIDPEKLYRATFIRQYGLCCCNMALVYFRLFCKNWDSCENFLGKWFTAPPPLPGKKIPVRLCVHSFQFKEKVLELNATMDQSSDRTVKHLCLWLQNEHGQHFCEEFASLPGGGGNYYRALKEGVTRIFRAVYLYKDSIFCDNCILHCHIILFTGMNIIVVRPP